MCSDVQLHILYSTYVKQQLAAFTVWLAASLTSKLLSMYDPCCCAYGWPSTTFFYLLELESIWNLRLLSPWSKRWVFCQCARHVATGQTITRDSHADVWETSYLWIDFHQPFVLCDIQLIHTSRSTQFLPFLHHALSVHDRRGCSSSDFMYCCYSSAEKQSLGTLGVCSFLAPGQA